MRLAPLLLLAAAPVLAAQDAMPRRPKLPKDADTNDAQAYYELVLSNKTSWNTKHDASYWAWRLDPPTTDYLYARWLILYQRQPQHWQVSFSEGSDYATKSKDGKLIDSLWPEILERDPFPHLDGPCYYPDLVDSKDPVVAGMGFFYQNCYTHAADRLKTALEKKPQLWGLRLRRAQALFFTSQYRASAAEIQVVLDTLRARDDKYLGQWYNTKELLEHMIGVALLRSRDVPGGKAALGRALTENLAYYPAHAALSRLAMSQGDLKTALEEAELAVGLEPNDGVLRYDYGVFLFRSGKLAEAEEQLTHAVAFEPYWATARLMLAETLERQEKAGEAVAAYQAFLARAPRRENIRIKEAEARIAALTAAGS